MTSEPPWPHPDPALETPLPPGVRPHRHKPKTLHGWVFLQEEVWIDYYGNEREIDSMPADYLENVIWFCKERAVWIHMLVFEEIVLQRDRRRNALGETVDQAEHQILLSVMRRVIADADELWRWINDLPLLCALQAQLDTRQRSSPGEDSEEGG